MSSRCPSGPRAGLGGRQRLFPALQERSNRSSTAAGSKNMCLSWEKCRPCRKSSGNHCKQNRSVHRVRFGAREPPNERTSQRLQSRLLLTCALRTAFLPKSKKYPSRKKRPAKQRLYKPLSLSIQAPLDNKCLFLGGCGI